MNNKMDKKNNYFLVVFIIIFSVLIVGGFFVVNNINNNTLSKNENGNTSVIYKSLLTTTTTPIVNQGNQSNYKNGEYSVKADYLDPENRIEQMTVRISLDNDKVIGINNIYSKSSRESKNYQAGFEDRIKDKIINKKISEIDNSVIAGASLTSEAFNIAISKIKTFAKK